MISSVFLKNKKTFFLDFLPMVIAATLIVTFAIIREQSFFKTLPTLITLVVQILLVYINPFAFLLGSVNSAIYGVVFLTEGLYFSSIQAFLISFPIQAYSFINWSKGKNKKDKKNVSLRRLSAGQLLAVLAAVGALWAAAYFGLAPFFSGATYPYIDALNFSISIAASILAAVFYVESQYFTFSGSLISLCTWILITIQAPQNLNYVILSLYNVFRLSQTSVTWTKRYINERRAESEAVTKANE